MTKTAAIIGGGVIGGGWLARFVLNGWEVRVYDPDPEAKRKIDAVLENARRALPMLYDVALPAEGSITYVDTIAEAVAGAVWIQESVPERLDLKARVFAEIEAAADAQALVGSSTSGFKPSQLQEGLARPDQVFVAHPFNPVYLLPLIEVVPSPLTSASVVARAKEVLTGLGLFPLHVRKEIDAHIADRFLEAVWREALWLIKDGIATTEEIDNAIRYGFGLRWGQMGLFETYRIAGGEAGMAHFIEQFGPCLSWPWTKLMDVPELTDALVAEIGAQSDAQSGALSIRELEALRDNNLVAMLRALKGQKAAAGALILAHETALMPDAAPRPDGRITTIDRVVPVDWTDYNGHMNESRYGQVYSDAADSILASLGADEAYVASGFSFFTVDIQIAFKAETHAGQRFHVATQVTEVKGKRINLHHTMLAEDGTILSTGAQVLIHVDMTARKACEPAPDLAGRMVALAQAHKDLPDPQDKREASQ